jgi:hypothetical protein
LDVKGGVNGGVVGGRELPGLGDIEGDNRQQIKWFAWILMAEVRLPF